MFIAVRTGLEPATPCVTGMYSNQAELPHQETILFVGVTGFEPATTRPPDVYSNRAELHPVKSLWDCGCKGTALF